MLALGTDAAVLAGFLSETSNGTSTGATANADPHNFEKMNGSLLLKANFEMFCVTEIDQYYRFCTFEVEH